MTNVWIAWYTLIQLLLITLKHSREYKGDVIRSAHDLDLQHTSKWHSNTLNTIRRWRSPDVWYEFADPANQISDRSPRKNVGSKYSNFYVIFSYGQTYRGMSHVLCNDALLQTISCLCGTSTTCTWSSWYLLSTHSGTAWAQPLLNLTSHIFHKLTPRKLEWLWPVISPQSPKVCSKMIPIHQKAKPKANTLDGPHLALVQT